MFDVYFKEKFSFDLIMFETAFKQTSERTMTQHDMNHFIFGLGRRKKIRML